MEEGFSFNYTKKEQAMRILKEDQREKESQMAYHNVMSELGLEIL